MGPAAINAGCGTVGVFEASPPHFPSSTGYRSIPPNLKYPGVTGWSVRLMSLIAPKSKTAVPTSIHSLGPVFLNCLQSTVFFGSADTLSWATAGIQKPIAEIKIRICLNISGSFVCALSSFEHGDYACFADTKTIRRHRFDPCRKHHPSLLTRRRLKVADVSSRTRCPQFSPCARACDKAALRKLQRVEP